MLLLILDKSGAVHDKYRRVTRILQRREKKAENTMRFSPQRRGGRFVRQQEGCGHDPYDDQTCCKPYVGQVIGEGANPLGVLLTSVFVNGYFSVRGRTQAAFAFCRPFQYDIDVSLEGLVGQLASNNAQRRWERYGLVVLTQVFDG